MFSLVLLLASTSGLIHLWMTQTQSSPPSTFPSSRTVLDIDRIHISPREAAKKGLQSVSGYEVAQMQIRSIKEEPWYQIFVKNIPKPIYVNALTGEIDQLRDEIYAREIAQTIFFGSPMKKSNYLTSFDSEYIAIFRILPVYRFDIDDGKGSRVYVSTVTGSVTRATDNKKQWEANVFSLFHKWSFIRDQKLRNICLGLATIGVLLASISGLVLFGLTRRTKNSKYV